MRLNQHGTESSNYDVAGLKHVSENVLVHSVEIDNVCSLLRHADRYMAQEAAAPLCFDGGFSESEVRIRTPLDFAHSSAVLSMQNG